MNVYNATKSRKEAKKKLEWDKAHPEGVRLIRWARTGKLEDVPDVQTNTVVVSLPERPKDWKK